MLILYISFIALLILLVFMIIIVRQDKKNREYKNTEEDSVLKKSLIKIVYFDEESASDFLDISAGGKAIFTREKIRERSTNKNAKFGVGVVPKYNSGVSGDINVGFDSSSLAKTIINKKISNTILTDYLKEASADSRIKKLKDFDVTAPEGSMAYIKMIAPYMTMINKINEVPLDLTKTDDVLSSVKGYYELVGEDPEGKKYVFRFNLKAFRNNYGLADLERMVLVFHGVRVGKTYEKNLNMGVGFSGGSKSSSLPSARDVVDHSQSTQSEEYLEVYDIILAGVDRSE